MKQDEEVECVRCGRIVYREAARFRKVPFQQDDEAICLYCLCEESLLEHVEEWPDDDRKAIH